MNKIKQAAGSSGTPIAVVSIVYDYFIFQRYNSILIIFLMLNLFLENCRETIDFKGNLHSAESDVRSRNSTRISY